MEKDSNPTVIHVINSSKLGGAEKQLLLLIRKQREANRRVLLFVFSKHKGEIIDLALDQGIVVGYLSSRNIIRTFFSLLLFVHKIILQSGKKKLILHAHLPRSEIVCCLLNLVFHVNFVVTRQNMENFLPNTKFVSLSSLISRLITDRCGLVIAISDAVSEFIKSQKEINEANVLKIRTIYYGYDDLRKLETKQTITSKRKELKMLAVGRLTEQKDLGTLLRACKELTSNLDWSLNIFGVGEEDTSLKAYARNLGLSGRVNWKGFEKSEDNIYLNTDLFILTSKYEGFGFVLLEAMLRDIAVLSSDIATSREILGQEYGGYFQVGNHIQLAEQISKFATREARKSLVYSYPISLSKFDPIEMEEKVWSAYEGLFGKNTKSNIR